MSGPAAVFAAANDALGRKVYAVWIVSAGGGPVASSSGVTVGTRAIARVPTARVDTLLIAGGEEASLRAVIAQPAVRR